MSTSGKKVSELSFITELSDDDYLPIVDISASTLQINSRKVTIGQLLPNATFNNKGLLKLAGDLAGTFDSPTVPGLQLKAPLENPTFTGQVILPTVNLSESSNLAATTYFVKQNILNSFTDSILIGTPRAVNPNNSDNSDRIATTSFVQNIAQNIRDTIVVNDATTTIKGIITISGDLSGDANNITVPELLNKANINSPNFTGIPTAPSPTSDDNSAKLATTAWVNTFVTGNLGADNPLWNAAKIQSRDISSAAPTEGQTLVWNSSTSVWEPGAPQFGAGTNVPQLNVTNQFTKTQGVNQVVLPWSSNILIDGSASNVFEISLTGNNATIDFTNLKQATYIVRLIQVNGGFDVNYSSLFKFPGGVKPTLSTNAGAIDELYCNADSNVLRCVLQKDFR